MGNENNISVWLETMQIDLWRNNSGILVKELTTFVVPNEQKQTVTNKHKIICYLSCSALWHVTKDNNSQ